MCRAKHLLLHCAVLTLFYSVHGVTDLSQITVLEENAITIDSVLDESGEWENIRIEMDPSITPNDTSVEVQRRLIETGGKKKVVITLALKGSFEGFNKRPLAFHNKGGKKLEVINGGRTAKRVDELDMENNAGVLTNRALSNDELFQVRIDRQINKYSTSLGVGVTHNTPRTMDYLGWMQCGVKMLYNNQYYENDIAVMKNYGPNLKTLRVGDRVGVMKKSNGDLHFFVNGNDLGVATTGINYPVYGVLDLFGNAVEASVVP